MIDRRGFSIIEIIVVVAILGALSVMASTYYHEYIQSAREATVKSNLKVIREAISQYFKRNMEYPSNFSQLPLIEPVPNLTLGILQDPNARLAIVVPDDTAGAAANAWLATVTKTVTLSLTQSGNGQQFRDIKITGDPRYNGW